MQHWQTVLVLLLIVTALVGCGGNTPASVEEQGNLAAGDSSDSESYTSAALDTSYPGALPVSSQLALGTFLLEETESAVTPEQAKTLLPLWQALQSGTLQNEAETNAVLRQIEGTMTEEQLAAIAAMQLTGADLRAWAQENGLRLGLSPGGGSGPPGNLSEEERASRRATAEAGGLPGSGQRGNPSEEERASRRATAEASGMTFPGRRAGAGPGHVSFLAKPLVDLLAQRAAE